jgi:hypothetical protein
MNLSSGNRIASTTGRFAFGESDHGAEAGFAPKGIVVGPRGEQGNLFKKNSILTAAVGISRIIVAVADFARI